MQGPPTVHRLPFWPVLLCAGLLLCGAVVLALFYGVDPASRDAIIFGFRLPRIAAAALVGAALAIAGVGLQGLTGNPLADPYLVGVASGASVGVGIGILLGIADRPGQPLLVLLALACALGAVLLVFGLARRRGQLSLSAFLLAGLIVGSFLSAGVSFLLVLARSDQSRMLMKLLGYLDEAGWEQIWVLAPVTVIGGIVLALCGRGLDAMAFGEATARSVGIEVERFKLGILCLVALLTACAVAVSGVIGFVGLVVPHLARALLGPPHRPLVPLAAVLGATLLVVADFASHHLLPDRQLPIGVLTALLGAPFFIGLLRRET